MDGNNEDRDEPMQIIRVDEDGETDADDEGYQIRFEEPDEVPPGVLNILFRRTLNVTRQRTRDSLRFRYIFHPRQPANATEDQNDDNESVPENAECFDTELPAEHSYLGNMVRVSGVDYLESNNLYRMLIFMHHSLIFPGETLPMIIPGVMFDTAQIPEEGLLFGVVFPNMWKKTKPNLYGVTCQIYEKGNDESGNITLLSRAHQRFMITKKYNPNFSEFLRPHQRKLYAKVLILPEIVLPDPLTSIDLGSMNKYRHVDSVSKTLRRIQASTTPWPSFVYNQYDIKSTIERAKKSLSSFKIESMPTDHVLLSFWLGQNLRFDEDERMKIFLTNSVNTRMQIIDKSFDNEKFFCCRRCKNRIANLNSLFAMSKHGVQSNYCNPSGFIHETKTVYSLSRNAVYPSESPSTEFSWFPGYSWQIIQCRLCDCHIGWKFVATKKNLVPRKFYGLSGTSVMVDSQNNDQERQSSSSDSQEQSEESSDQDNIVLLPYQL